MKNTNFWKSSLMILLFCFGLTSLWGQHNISQVGSENVYTQTFDSFTGTTQTIPAGWTLSATPSGYYNRSNGTYATNNLYSLRDNASSTDNAIGGKVAANSGTCSSTGTRTITFSVKNMTGAPITGFVLNWNVEQYSQGGRATTLNLTHNFGGTTTGTSTFTATTGTEGNLSSIVSTARGITISELTLANEATGTFTFTICTGSGSGNNGHVGIDDFTLYAVGPTTPSISIDPTTITGLQSVENGAASTPASFTMTGNTLDGSDVTIIADGEVFEISATQNGAYSDIVELEAYDGTEQTIWVRLAANQTAGVKNGTILIDGGGIEEPIEVEVQGNVITSDPVLIVSEESLEGLTYTFNAGPSTPKSFTISGLNMEDADGDMMLMFAETSDFEMSLEAASNYQDDLLIENYDGTETTIYVRLKAGLAIGAAYSDILEIMSDYDVEGSVLVFGEVLTPPASTTVSETALSGFHYNVGNGPSAEQTFTVSGAYLTGNITVTAPTNYQVSLSSGSDFQNSVILTPTDGFVNETTVYVRLNSGLGLNNYNGNITVSTAGVANKTIALSGSVTCATITSFPFTETFENSSDSRGCWTQFQEVGSGNWTFAAGSGAGNITSAQSGSLNARFVSQNGTANPITKLITPVLDLTSVSAPRLTFYYGQELWSTDQNQLKVYYRTSPSDSWVEIAHYTNNINSWTQEILLLPNPSATYQIAFEGINNWGRANVLDFVTIENTPSTIEINPAIVPAFAADLGETDGEDITITGLSLSDDISISLGGANADQFSLSVNTLGAEGGTLTITYEPTTLGSHTATVTLSSEGADDVVLEINGTATFGIPTALPANPISHNKFTANWNSVTGAEGYELDVYSKIGGINDTDTEVFNITASGSQPSAPSGWTYTNIATSNDYLKMVQANSNNGAPTIITPVLDVSNFTTLNLTADIATFGSPTAGQRTVTISVSTDGGSWQTVDTMARSSNDGSNYENKEIQLEDYIGNSQFRIKFEALNATTSVGPRLKNIILGGIEYSIVLNPIDGSPYNSTGNSYEVTGLDPESTYYYVVRAVSGETTSANSNEIEVETAAEPEAIIWTINDEWSNLTGPTINDDVIIEGELTIGDDEYIAAKNLLVAEGGKIQIATNGSLELAGKITNESGAANFTVENGGNLIQNTEFTGSNDGAITVIRYSAPMKRLDYAMWSSPVTGQNLFGFSPLTVNGVTNYAGSEGRIYIYNGTLGYIHPDPFTAEAVMNTGVGYLFRAPNNFHATDLVPYMGVFTGVPNNGTINVELTSTPGEDDPYTSMGNPYPSNIRAIGADSFFSVNSQVNSIHFWVNEGEGAYLSCSTGGCTDFSDLNYISAGQGFIVEHIPGQTADVTFTNAMRVDDSASFYNKTDDAERHRFWLNLSNETNGSLNQILTGYMENATNEVDQQIDAKLFGYEGSALYNIIQEEAFAIQGRALPFESSDVVPLGFRAAEGGKYKISLANFDGIFADGAVTIYLKDNQLDVYHNLMESDYEFESAQGTFKERFEVVYETEGTMGIGDFDSGLVQVYQHNNHIVVSSKTEKILSVELFDLQGRNIHRNVKVNASVYEIPSASFGTQVLVVKVQTENGKVVTKKLINK